ncbi:MAG: pilus assembly protein TadG-related protein, partial [Thermoguttaceae bacterium]
MNMHDLAPRWPSVKRRPQPCQRRGAAVVLFVVALIPLIACVALAVDLGLLTVAQTQLRDAADAAALAGARALNGNITNNCNYSAATPAAQNVVNNNVVLGGSLTNTNLTVNIGCYTYNSTAQQFQGTFPSTLGSNQMWNLVQASVTANVSGNMGFSKIFSFSTPNLSATATAAYRPRDICMILDYSGSMRFGSLLGLPISGNRTTNNQDTIYPQWGHYAGNSSLIQAPSPASPYQDCNISTTTSDGRPPIIQDFYTNSSGSPAFSYATTAYCTAPGGDKPLTTSNNTSTTYAQSLNLVFSPTSTYSAAFESSGYRSLTGGTLSGYTQGPGYWGKTFFLWPPDPTNDWRVKYLGTNDNTDLWDSSGSWKVPTSSRYMPNYTAILNFIKNVGPCPFPSRLQSGRILYYSSIPSSIDTSTWPPTNIDQRFWKDYIDYVLGFLQTDSNTYSSVCDGNTGLAGYGSDFNWGNVQISSPPSGNPKPYMNYKDNPQRPLLHFWFGPLSMIDFLGNYNVWENSATYYNYCDWWPGTCHETPLYACKLGIQAALNDIQNNHPSDMVSLIMFASPQSASTDAPPDRFNRVRVPLSQNYSNMLDSLWYPPSTVGNSTATISPYDADNINVPRALGGT